MEFSKVLLTNVNKRDWLEVLNIYVYLYEHNVDIILCTFGIVERLV